MIREATIADIPQLQIIRNSVKENTLLNPALVTNEAVADYLTRRGKGWVYEDNGKIAGFAIADLQDHNIWALFLHPDFEGKGIGQLLHHTMLNWYFQQTQNTVWLGTSPNTRAEKFYRRAGWQHTGMHGSNELKFEMTFDKWKSLQQNAGS